MKLTFVTLFPEFFDGPLRTSIPARAEQAGQVSFACVNPREFASGVHRTVDDKPYGGGAGMVMRPVELCAAIDHASSAQPAHRIYLSPQGRPFTQRRARELAALPHLVFVCGRYEGIDERVITSRIDEEISVGDFVLSGGEPAAFCVADAVIRLLDGALGNDESVVDESFSSGLLEYPQFTRPAEFEGEGVPEVLTSGDHGRVERWRRKCSLLRTLHRRPDLLAERSLSDAERALVDDPSLEVPESYYLPQCSKGQKSGG